MRIAHIAPPWIAVPPDNYGGTENVISNIVEEQVAQGYDVTLFAPGDAQTTAHLVSFIPHSLLSAGVPWHAHLKAFYHIFKSIEHIKDHKYDIVHLHLSSSADMYLFPLLMQAKTPLVMTLHSRFPFDRADSWTGDADKFFLEWMSSVPMVAISQHACEEVPYPLNFVGVVHHGLPMHIWRPTVTEPENYLVWLGRFVPEKGAHLAIEVARATGIPLILAGVVDYDISQAAHYYEEVIKPQVDGEHIKYIGPVNLQEKIDLLSRARAFLNPISWEEPFGMVMIEAMAVGCPVISFTRGAAPEIVAHQKSGYLVNDLQEMIRCVASVDQLERSAVRAHIKQNFSARAMVEKYQRIYRQVCGGVLPVRTTSLTRLTVPDPSVTAMSSRLMSRSVHTPVVEKRVPKVYRSHHVPEIAIEVEPESLQ